MTAPKASSRNPAELLRIGLLLPVSALLAVALVGILGFLLWLKRDYVYADLATHTENQAHALHATLARQQQLHTLVHEVMASDWRLAYQLRTAQSDALRLRYGPIYDRLRARAGVTRLGFYAADGAPVQVIDSPLHDAAQAAKPLALSARPQPGETIEQTALDQHGVVVLRSIHPIYEGQRLVGLVELATEVSELLARQTIHEHADLVVTANTPLPPNPLATGTDRAPSVRTLYASLDIDSEPLQTFLAGSEHAREHDTIQLIKSGSTTWHAQSFPILDPRGEPVAKAHVLVDLSGPNRAFNQISAVFAGGALTLCIAVYFIFVRRILKTEHQLMTNQSALQASEQRLRQITRAGKTGLWQSDLSGSKVLVDGYLREVLELKDEQVHSTQDGWYQIASSLRLDEHSPVLESAQRNNWRQFQIEHVVQTPSGQRRWLLIHGRFVTDTGSRKLGGTATDITELKLVEERLRANEERLNLAISVANEGVWDWHMDTDQVFFDERYYTMAGYEPGEFPGCFDAFIERVHPDDLHGVQRAIDNYLSGDADEYRVEFRLRCKDASFMWIEAKGKLFHDEGTDGPTLRFVGTHADINARREAQDQLRYQAHHDMLTQLPNRRMSLDRLAEALAVAERARRQVAVMYLDLDDFKKINDSLGHEAGDLLLQEAARRLRSCLAVGDTVGRLGGDEFVIVLSDLNHAQDAASVAQRLLREFHAPVQIANRELLVTTSIGIAMYPDDGVTASDLLRKADAALYRSKAEGRDTYSYFTEMLNETATRRVLVEEQLHAALARGEMHLVYQPQIHIATGAVTGFEALLRWSNPVLGAISPAEFIPIAEQTGLIVDIGDFVFEHALGWIGERNRDRPHPVCIAVNVSPRQIRDPDFIAKLNHWLAIHAVAPQQVELEITEGVLLAGLGSIDETITRLAAMGFSIAMDDFGTGYASLSYLRHYAFDVIKIDRSFVRDLCVDTADRALISAAIAMAHALDMKVVAEGIESAEQLAALNDLGCDLGQGYWIGKPALPDVAKAQLQAAFPSA